MPTYEYRCANGHEFERFQKMSDDPVDTCPECGGAAERLLSAGAGLLFKGSGFYITDSRDSDYQKRASTDGGTASGSNSSTSSESTKKASTGSGSSEGSSAKADATPPKPSSGGASKDGGGASKSS